MQSAVEHQCLIYEGAPTQQFFRLGSTLNSKLTAKYRCLYWESPGMVADFRSFLSAQGIDAARETGEGNLLLTSSQDHLLNGWEFDVDAMMRMLARTLEDALRDGYQGLWATGDVAWEFGPSRDFSRLLEYERRLENFVGQNPKIGGICQYRADTLPREVLRQGLAVHQHLFEEESASPNSWYAPQPLPRSREDDDELDAAIDRILLAQSPHSEIMIELSDSLRQKAEQLANLDGISLEDFLLFAVAEKIERCHTSRPSPFAKRPRSN